jgi:putative membrane-bound dehydrogenase-like protein
LSLVSITMMQFMWKQSISHAVTVLVILQACGVARGAGPEDAAAAELSPQRAVERMTVADGFRANLYAAEPMIGQPMAFCWDAKGRMWIAENRDYESRGGGFSSDGTSRILILEDTDRDGAADTSTVFLEGIPFPAAIAVGFGGLWLGAPPNLLFVPDRDGDDRADMDAIEVRLTGWGIRDRHETLNSLIWGPDGWLYGLQGFATSSTVGRPAGKGRLLRHRDPFPDRYEFDGPTVEINGGVWRYHPTKDRFEVVAHGLSNPWGIDYDAKGQLFLTACVIPHLWHIVPGGIYHRQGGSHFNPHVYADLRTIADHAHKSAHGGARVYQSDAFPDRYRGRIFMANIHEHAVLTDVLERRGSGFVGRHGDELLQAHDDKWVGFSMEVGPEGAVYVLDWHDADICGTRVLHKETGRVFRIAPTASAAAAFPHRDADLNGLDDAALVDLQRVPSVWHATQARTILQHRAVSRPIDPPAVARLRDWFGAGQPVDLRLRAMWALHVIGGLPPETLRAALADDEEYVRGWAIQLLCEDRAAPPDVTAELAAMAARDPSPVVRLYLASAIQRVGPAAAWSILESLARRDEDRDDHNIPKLIWFGLEPLVVGDPPRAAALAASARLPLVSRHVGRRLAAAGLFDPLLAAIGAADASASAAMLLGIRDAIDGRADGRPPAAWDRVAPRLESAGGETAAVAAQLTQRFASSANASALQTLADPAAAVADRRLALEALAGRRAADLVPRIVPLIDDAALRPAAIRAVAAYDDAPLAAALLARYAGFTADERADAIDALASRAGHGRALLEAVRRGDVPRADVRPHVARQLRRVVGNSGVDVWGPIDLLPADQEAAYAKYRGLLGEAALRAADRAHGREVYKRTCASCHVLHGEGGSVGPDITGANRGSLDYLLSNILTPSEVIQDAYRMQVILLDDGRVHSGIPAGEDGEHLRLRVANQPEPIVIPLAQIASREVSANSLMPDGLLAVLSDAEVLDLVAYLQTARPGPDAPRLP